MTLSKVAQECCPPYPAWSIRYHLHPREGPKKQGDNSIGLNVCKSTPKRCLLHPKTAIQGRKNTQVGREEQKVNKRKEETTKDNGCHYLPLQQARNSLPGSHLEECFSVQNMKTHGPESLIFNNSNNETERSTDC